LGIENDVRTFLSILTLLSVVRWLLNVLAMSTSGQFQPLLTGSNGAFSALLHRPHSGRSGHTGLCCIAKLLEIIRMPIECQLNAKDAVKVQSKRCVSDPRTFCCGSATNVKRHGKAKIRSTSINLKTMER
jgi:hypothetical protein